MNEHIIIRNYSKVIFFYPMMIYCLIAFIIEKIHEVRQPLENAYSQLGWLFIIFLFMNIFVTTFDISLKSFIVLIVIAVLTLLILFFTNVLNFEPIPTGTFVFNLGVPSNFYLLSFILIVFLLLLAVVQARFRYIEIERQEIQIHGFLETGVKQYNSSDMSYEIDFADVFEYIAARSGTITFKFKDGNSIILDTVLNLKKKRNQLDELRNSIAVKIQNP